MLVHQDKLHSTAFPDKINPPACTYNIHTYRLKYGFPFKNIDF